MVYIIFVVYVKYLQVFNIMYLIYSGMPVKCWFDAAKYHGNILVDLKIK